MSQLNLEDIFANNDTEKIIHFLYYDLEELLLDQENKVFFISSFCINRDYVFNKTISLSVEGKSAILTFEITPDF